MKPFAKIVGIGLLGGLSLCWLPQANAAVSVGASVQIRATVDFDVPLATHGAWVEVRGHGRCWRPARVAVDWRPYCDGRWIWTDCGWYWESDEPWAWACYHYGTWVFDTGVGWVWIPGVEWAPAWVQWRVGGGHVGWAPCPPRGVIIAPAHFSFVVVGRFHDRIHRSSVVFNDTTIINQTKEITEIKRVRREIDGARKDIVFNEGPGVAEIQKATGRKLDAVPIQEAARRTPAPRQEKSAAQPADKKEGRPGGEARPSRPEPKNDDDKSRVRPDPEPKRDTPDFDKPSRSEERKGRPDSEGRRSKDSNKGGGGKGKP